MRRFFWPLLATLLLEGWFLHLPLWWIVTAAAIALSVRLACGVVKAHRAQEELIARFNDENPPHPRKSLAMPRRASSTSPRPADIGGAFKMGTVRSDWSFDQLPQSPSVPMRPSTAARAVSSDVGP
jgi:hypothetical protein